MSRKKDGDHGRDPGANKSSSYEIGYGKPPLHTQWQRGQSGNSRGRPKACLNQQTYRTMLAEALAELVSIQGTDGRRKVSKQEALFKKLINDALTGGAREMRLLFETLSKFMPAQAPIIDNPGDRDGIEGTGALHHYVDRAIRRRSLEYNAYAENDEDGSS